MFYAVMEIIVDLPNVDNIVQAQDAAKLLEESVVIESPTQVIDVRITDVDCIPEEDL